MNAMVKRTVLASLMFGAGVLAVQAQEGRRARGAYQSIAQ